MTSLILPLAANIGAKALYLLIVWLFGSIVCGHIAERKGYGERLGLATGFIFVAASILVAVVWLFVPAKENSAWKTDGAFGRRSTPG